MHCTGTTYIDANSENKWRIFRRGGVQRSTFFEFEISIDFFESDSSRGFEMNDSFVFNDFSFDVCAIGYPPVDGFYGFSAIHHTTC